MLSNAKHMLDKCTGNAEHILCTYLQYADHIQCLGRATLPIGEKTEEKKKRRRKKAVPRAAKVTSYILQLYVVHYESLLYRTVIAKVFFIKNFHCGEKCQKFQDQNLQTKER